MRTRRKGNSASRSSWRVGLVGVQHSANALGVTEDSKRWPGARPRMFIMGGAREAEREGFESPRLAVGGCGVVARGRLRRCCSRRAQLGLTGLLASGPGWCAALGEHPRCNRGFEAVAGSSTPNVHHGRTREAEREGFEPSVEEYPQQRFSRPPPSTTRSPLRAVGSLAWCVGRARQRMAITFQGTAVSDLVRSAHGRNHER